MRLSSRNTKRSNISTYLVSNDLTNIGFITLSSISFISIYADVDRNEQIFLSVCFEWLCAYLISILWFQVLCKQCSILSWQFYYVDTIFIIRISGESLPTFLYFQIIVLFLVIFDIV